jgi:long-chain acyl-CoA synthetase
MASGPLAVGVAFGFKELGRFDGRAIVAIRGSSASKEAHRGRGMDTHLYEVLRRRASSHPDTVALGGQHGLIWRSITSRELLGLVDSLATELAARGIGPGDRVVLWLPNQWQTPVYLWACWRLGAVVVPFDRETNPEAAARIVTAVEPKRILVGFGIRPHWAPADLAEEWWEPTLREPADQPADDWPQPSEELAAIYFTSGTTGVPKGCMIGHANLLSQIDAAQDLIPLGEGCRLASILPLSHLFELTCGLLYPVAAGAAVHYVPSRRGPDIVRVLKEQKITHMLAVPQLLELMGRAVESQLQGRLGTTAYRQLRLAAGKAPFIARRALFWPALRRLGGNLQLLAAGGAALPAETQRLWETMGVRVIQGYGASECSPIIAGGRPDGSTPLGSVGKPIRHVEVKLSADGELLVRGPNVMRGYWKDPERTAEVLQDGWYHTGDLARLDQDGNIFLAGRARDLIVLPSGMKVWPQDVEDVLRQQPGVRDAAVVTAPTATGGTVLHAFLIRDGSPDGAPDLASIVAASNGRLAQHQRLATASWWREGDFPRTSTLKVQRHLLPSPQATESVDVDSVMAADDPVGRAIVEAARVASVKDEQTLAELGLDSLALLDLAIALEDKTGKAVAEGDLGPDMTVGEVRARMAAAPALGVGAESTHTRLTGPPAGERVSASQPLWPYTWRGPRQVLRLPIDLAYRHYVTETIVRGGEHLVDLPQRVIFAGTHHAYADFPLVHQALKQTPARELASRLVVAARATAFDAAGPAAWFGTLALGLYPLRQYGEQDTSLRGLAHLAEEGHAILIFPQGKHVRPEAERAGDPDAGFKTGVGHLASALQAKVVPFGLAGTEAVFPNVDHARLMIGDIPVALRKGPVAIVFGAPLEMQPNEAPTEFASRLQGACFELTREAEAALGPAEVLAGSPAPS